MTVVIRCDNCGIELFRKDWQHRKNEVILCHDCYNAPRELISEELKTQIGVEQ